MTPRRIYTRAYSKSSAGGLSSAKVRIDYPLADAVLLEEFRNHANRRNREPTALVSASDRIVDTLKRAFDKYYKFGELTADIWIAFIELTPVTKNTLNRIHSAIELAEKCKLKEPSRFSHEVVF